MAGEQAVIKELAKTTGVAPGDVAKVLKALGGVGRKPSAASTSTGAKPFNLQFVKIGRLVVAI